MEETFTKNEVAEIAKKYHSLIVGYSGASDHDLRIVEKILIAEIISAVTLRNACLDVALAEEELRELKAAQSGANLRGTKNE